MCSAANHFIGETVASLTCNGDVAVLSNTTSLVAKIKNRNSCPKTAVSNARIGLVESPIIADALHSLKLRQGVGLCRSCGSGHCYSWFSLCRDLQRVHGKGDRDYQNRYDEEFC